MQRVQIRTKSALKRHIKSARGNFCFCIQKHCAPFWQFTALCNKVEQQKTPAKCLQIRAFCLFSAVFSVSQKVFAWFVVCAWACGVWLCRTSCSAVPSRLRDLRLYKPNIGRRKKPSRFVIAHPHSALFVFTISNGFFGLFLCAVHEKMADK